MAIVGDPQAGQEPSLYGQEPLQQAPQEPAPGLVDQFVGVLTEPVALFQRLNRTPVFWGALLLITVTAVAATVIWGLKVDVDAMMRPALERNPALNADQIDSAISMQGKFILPFGVLGALLGTPIAIAFFALINWGLACLFPEGERPTYKHAMSAVAVTGLLGVLRNVLVMVMCVLRPVGGATPEKLVPTNPGFFIHVANPKLQALLTSLDLLTIGSLVLGFLAMRHVLRGRSVAAWISTALGILATLVAVAFAK